MLFQWRTIMNDRYLTENLGTLIRLTDRMWEVHGMFVSELINFSFFLAIDMDMNPFGLSINGDDYVFIFTILEEFDRAYPSEDILERK